VIVNRDGIGDGRMDEYLQSTGLPVLMRIPMQRDIAEALARGETLVGAFPEYLPRFRQLHERIVALTGAPMEPNP
jgi:MinD superfamily P-loop ATPase